MTSLSQELWRGSTEIAESCLQHPFVRGLAEGTLPPQRYARFIAQDAFFLDVFARGYAAGVFRAPDHEGRRVWHELQSGVFEELELHAAASKEMGIDLTRVTPLQATPRLHRLPARQRLRRDAGRAAGGHGALHEAVLLPRFAPG